MIIKLLRMTSLAALLATGCVSLRSSEKALIASEPGGAATSFVNHSRERNVAAAPCCRGQPRFSKPSQPTSSISTIRPSANHDPSNPHAPEAATPAAKAELMVEEEISAPGTTSAEPAAHEHAVYTCPMHASVQNDRPGDCPICGMTLVPKADEP